MNKLKRWTDEQVLGELYYLLSVGAYHSAEIVLRELVIRKEKANESC